ncbi:twin-arginine translocation signal domain-containing protein [Catalinimonas sp. 4WD22]|uniref:twin-arginine translocation signal domain-containing protein n=1 Tax=Catalinimonas locisalis TaxID=3133978 RepID=UPI00310194F9
MGNLQESSRRDFIKKSALAATTLGLMPHLHAGNISKAGLAGRLTDQSIIGIQMAAHSMFDEGIALVMDFLADEAEINTLMIYSHTYYGIGNKPYQVLAKDHIKPPKNLIDRKLPPVWVKHNEEAFKDTKLRHAKPDPALEYQHRDIFKEVLKPARERNMKIYVRMLESGGGAGENQIINYDMVKVVDIYGNKGDIACWNNPDYQQWLFATMEDMFNAYEIDGLQYGAERTGPLSLLLFKGEVPSCFCEHCQQRNRSKGIDPERAREGYRLLYEYIKKVETGTADKTETVMTHIWRYLQQYPELLGWNYQWFQADEENQQQIYDRVKKINSAVVVGRHVDHQRSSWDPFYRAAISYDEMTKSADFIKPILYHDIYGPRLRWWVIEEWQQRMFNDFTREETLNYLYKTMGYSPESQIALDKLAVEGMGPEYVYSEIKRCVDSIQDGTEVVAGLGIDVMWHGKDGNPQPFPSDPVRLQKAVYKAVEAGASGLLASREYDEMRYSSLRAFGDAVRQLK